MEKRAIFKLSDFRRNNSVSLWLVTPDNKYQILNQVTALNQPEVDVTLTYNSFGQVWDKLNQLGPIVRSTINSVAESNNWTIGGCLDIPIKPYIKASSHITQTVRFILPYTTSELDIFKPLANLYAISLPRRGAEKATDDIVDSLQGWVEDTFEGETNRFWLTLKDTLSGYIGDFLKDLYLLRDPIQFKRENSLHLYWGPLYFKDVFITGIKVSYGKALYTDLDDETYVFSDHERSIMPSGRTVMPTHATVDVTFTSKTAARPDSIFTDKNTIEAMADAEIANLL